MPTEALIRPGAGAFVDQQASTGAGGRGKGCCVLARMGAVAAPGVDSYCCTTAASVGGLGFIRLKSISGLLWRE
ncbi:metallopeptidase, family M24 [Pseudomonas sp. St29]|nr:metallopeptidase, family M24 [Pseudomonas sp. St29]